jgi:hypothetical protein
MVTLMMTMQRRKLAQISPVGAIAPRATRMMMRMSPTFFERRDPEPKFRSSLSDRWEFKPKIGPSADTQHGKSGRVEIRKCSFDNNSLDKQKT